MADGGVTNIGHPGWMPVDDTYGKVPVSLVAPDPDNPRQHVDPTRLTELQDSIARQGVRQPAVVTPIANAPWVQIDRDQYPDAVFVAVSGNRRRRASIAAGKTDDFPVLVRIYGQQVDHLLDASLLNHNQVELSALEQAMELGRLVQHGMSVGDLQKAFGHSIPTIHGRLHLLNLSPAILEERLHPATIDEELPALGIGTASALGALPAPTFGQLRDLAAFLDFDIGAEAGTPSDDLKFEMHELILAKIDDEGMNGEAAKDYIKRCQDKMLGQVREASVRRPNEPRKMRGRILSVARAVMHSSVFRWSASDLSYALGTASRSDLDAVEQDLTRAIEAMTEFRKRLQTSRKS